MKRIIAVILTLASFSFVGSCTDVAPRVTVSDVVSQFDENIYIVQEYDDIQVSEISSKLELEGEILAIVHIINKNTASPNLEWTYVYEFESENDAKWFEENRQVFVSSLHNGISFKSGNVVVYGNSDVIYDLSIK